MFSQDKMAKYGKMSPLLVFIHCFLAFLNIIVVIIAKRSKNTVILIENTGVYVRFVNPK